MPLPAGTEKLDNVYLPPDKHPPGSRIRRYIGTGLNAGLVLIVLGPDAMLNIPSALGTAILIGGAAPYVAYLFWWQRQQKRDTAPE